jgi:hypothetical protein
MFCISASANFRIHARHAIPILKSKCHMYTSLFAISPYYYLYPYDTKSQHLPQKPHFTPRRKCPCTLWTIGWVDQSQSGHSCKKKIPLSLPRIEPCSVSSQALTVLTGVFQLHKMKGTTITRFKMYITHLFIVLHYSKTREDPSTRSWQNLTVSKS